MNGPDLKFHKGQKLFDVLQWWQVKRIDPVEVLGWHYTEQGVVYDLLRAGQHPYTTSKEEDLFDDFEDAKEELFLRIQFQNLPHESDPYDRRTNEDYYAWKNTGAVVVQGTENK